MKQQDKDSGRFLPFDFALEDLALTFDCKKAKEEARECKTRGDDAVLMMMKKEVGSEVALRLLALEDAVEFQVLEGFQGVHLQQLNVSRGWCRSSRLYLRRRAIAPASGRRKPRDLPARLAPRGLPPRKIARKESRSGEGRGYLPLIGRPALLPRRPHNHHRQRHKRCSSCVSVFIPVTLN